MIAATMQVTDTRIMLASSATQSCPEVSVITKSSRFTKQGKNG